MIGPFCNIYSVSQASTKLGGKMTKYSTTIERRMPLKTSPFPLLWLASVNQRMAPTRTMMTPETCPIKMRKSQISAKYAAMRFTKFTRGLCSNKYGIVLSPRVLVIVVSETQTAEVRQVRE